ncbi:MAG: transketolase [Firmicutes bacterium]|nr:transketolase [Bacillota bacterium]
MEMCSRVHARNLVEFARLHPEIVVLSADLTGSTEIDAFQAAYPERFYSMGMTEQSMLSMAGGMAREGMIPFIHTFAVFLYRRALDQLAMSIAYPNLPVRLFGFLPGIISPGGATHQAIEDIAVMRALPNMTIIECGDATDVESVLSAAHAVDGPVYVRMLRGDIPRLFAADDPLQLGVVRELASGTDVALFSSGICTEEAMRATAVLRDRGVRLTHVHVSTLKPFVASSVLGYIEQARHGVIVMENHSVVGGLGSVIAEVMAENGCASRLVRMGLRDQFAHGASQRSLMREYGLDALALVRHVEAVLRQPLGITEQDLAAERIAPVHSKAKAEAL